jgi:hypothetical protein
LESSIAVRGVRVKAMPCDRERREGGPTMSREEIRFHEHDPIQILEELHLHHPQLLEVMADMEVRFQFPFLEEGSLEKFQCSSHDRGCDLLGPLFTLRDCDCSCCWLLWKSDPNFGFFDQRVEVLISYHHVTQGVTREREKRATAIVTLITLRSNWTEWDGKEPNGEGGEGERRRKVMGKIQMRADLLF